MWEMARSVWSPPVGKIPVSKPQYTCNETRRGKERRGEERRAEQSRAEQSRAEQSRAEEGRAGKGMRGKERVMMRLRISILSHLDIFSSL